MGMEDIALLSASALQSKLRKKDISPVAVAGTCFRDVERFNTVVMLNDQLLKEALDLRQ